MRLLSKASCKIDNDKISIFVTMNSLNGISTQTRISGEQMASVTSDFCNREQDRMCTERFKTEKIAVCDFHLKCI